MVLCHLAAENYDKFKKGCEEYHWEDLGNVLVEDAPPKQYDCPGLEADRNATQIFSGGETGDVARTLVRWYNFEDFHAWGAAFSTSLVQFPHLYVALFDYIISAT